MLFLGNIVMVTAGNIVGGVVFGRCDLLASLSCCCRRLEPR